MGTDKHEAKVNAGHDTGSWPAARSNDVVPDYRIKLLATGGTIEKTYDPAAGALSLSNPGLDAVLDALDHPTTELDVERLMAIDSLDMCADEQRRIVDTAAECAKAGGRDALIVTHGTDRLAPTARLVAEQEPAMPVVFTGAMIPAACADSDAHANLAQALLAARLLPPGVFVAFHGRAIAAERAVKDYAAGTFIECILS
ncbi:asparaginase [Salinisphaera sp. USBA-960]|uniref:asparaginase domain-containing protein n=1 Tax=Salinisphaera orenii TaxID=856731 RepID=UPI000DBE52A2|nr:asparaginase [Salifodinibacter halophilus]NNC25655.1 asparaginase [Salifodinibacter halophilus]